MNCRIVNTIAVSGCIPLSESRTPLPQSLLEAARSTFDQRSSHLIDVGPQCRLVALEAMLVKIFLTPLYSHECIQDHHISVSTISVLNNSNNIR
jgi:hypothetical protein